MNKRLTVLLLVALLTVGVGTVLFAQSFVEDDLTLSFDAGETHVLMVGMSAVDAVEMTYTEGDWDATGPGAHATQDGDTPDSEVAGRLQYTLHDMTVDHKITVECDTGSYVASSLTADITDLDAGGSDLETLADNDPVAAAAVSITSTAADLILGIDPVDTWTGTGVDYGAQVTYHLVADAGVLLATVTYTILAE